MKITKTELRKLIREAVEELDNAPAPRSPKVSPDVEKINIRLDQISGFDQLLAKLNTSEEFEQFLRKVIRSSSENVKHKDILLAVSNVEKALRKELE